MNHFRYIEINKNRIFQICPGCCGLPLLPLKPLGLLDQLCQECRFEYTKFYIQQWEAEKELAAFTQESHAIKFLPFEKRMRIGYLINLLESLNERKSNNGYKAEENLNYKKPGRSKQKTIGTQTGISQNEQAGVGA